MFDHDIDSYRFVFRSTKVASFEFHPVYAAQYEYTPQGCRWSPIGNESMRSRGNIQVRGLGDGVVEVDYHERIECDLQLGRVVGAVVAPIARELLRKSILAYLEHSRQALELC